MRRGRARFRLAGRPGGWSGTPEELLGFGVGRNSSTRMIQTNYFPSQEVVRTD